MTVPAAPAPSDGNRTPPAPPPYARGSWRLAKAGALEQVALWFSQIVIRHADARPEVSFNLAFWSSVSTPSRGRAEALELAEQLAERVARDVSQFPALARQYSEDLPSRDEGGSMGAMSAFQMDAWPQILDALEALQPGQTSRVVESPYGFHILRSLEAPAAENVSGSHIVIGHDAAPWLQVFARGNAPHRTREEALALANALHREALAEPSRFSELVRRHSEHQDAVADGDFGSWSTHEPNPFPPRTQRARELAMGQVGAPIETHLGFEIIQRTPPRQRGQYRAELLIFPFLQMTDQGRSLVDPVARAAALEKATAAAERFALAPSKFDEHANELSIMQWQAGRENHQITAAIQGLLPGQITPSFVECEHGFVVARRLEPQSVQPPAFTSELPVPNAAGLAEFLAALPARAAAPFLLGRAQRAARELSVPNGVAERLISIHQLSASYEELAPEARRGAVDEMFTQTRSLLGEKRFTRYLASLSWDAATSLLPADQHGRLGL
jgi:hypothetical protein